MKHPLLAATLAASLALPGAAQTSIPAPAGWTTRTKTGGATTFTPPDLRAGEVYNVTVYEAAPLNDQTLAEYLRGFAGPVGTKPGQLKAPLNITVNGLNVVGGGVYRGPNGKELGTAFVGTAPDDRHIYVARTLFSGLSEAALARYIKAEGAPVGALLELARREAGQNAVRVPERVLEHIKPGGDIVPGIYAGNQLWGEEVKYRLRLYLYPSGEYQFKSENDTEYQNRWGSTTGVGTVGYSRNTGQMGLGNDFDMINGRGGDDPDAQFCYYGRNSAGQPTIYARKSNILGLVTTSLTLVKPLAPSVSPSAIKARADAKVAQAERAAEAEHRKMIVAPGKGVQSAQIAAVLYGFIYNPYGSAHSEYLLLRDGTAYDGLPDIALDEFNTSVSKRQEPKKWGRWRRAGNKYLASWNGKPFEELHGAPVAPAPAGLRLAGHYHGGAGYNNFSSSSWTSWGTTFDKAGRFRDDGVESVASGRFGFDGSGYVTRSDENGSSTSMQGSTLPGQPSFVLGGSTSKTPPKKSKSGTYSFNGYTLILRYSDGRTVRTPAFFLDDKHDALWKDGGTIFLDKPK